MAFEFLRSVGHGEMTAAIGVLATVVSQSVSPTFARLVFLGQIGYFIEFLLGTAAVAIGIVGMFECSRLTSSDFDAPHIDEQCHPTNDELAVRDQGFSMRDDEVTIRLDGRFLRTFHRHRCIVTIRGTSGSVRDGGQEVWYARDKN